MSTLRISNIEAKSVPASPTLDEKVKITNSTGDILIHVDGKTSGITTIGINTTASNITFDANSNIVVTGVITASHFYGNGSGLTNLATNLVNDTTPQLGGNLDTNSHEISLDTSHAINFGDSNELRVFYHSGNGQIDFNGTTSLQLKTPANKYFQVVNRDTGNNIIQAQAGGNVQLYHNGAMKFDTITTGVRVHGDEGAAAQLHLLADQGDDNPDYWRFIAETNGILNIQDYGSGSWYNNIRLTGNTGGVELYHNNSKKIETSSTGITISGNANFLNNNKIILGTGADAEIFHNDTDFHIDAQASGGATRNIYMTCGTVNEGGFFVRSNAGDTMFKALTDSSCFLYFDDSLKFRTMTDHCEIRGHLLPDTTNTDDIGSSSKRFRNIYTNDLNLSNKGSTNNVDNTWGDYTIQEGESDLFLINNRSGKKYKFNLTEVS